MKLSEIGEFGLIDRLTEIANKSRDDRRAAWQRLVTGIGDDTAVWQNEPGTQLATIDAMIEGVHFTRSTLSWADLGWKALAVNLSDIAAMGGTPRYALVSLALPGDTEVEDVIAMYEGMVELAAETGTALAGGDTCRAPEVSVTIAVYGAADEAGILSRASARPGDLIAVTGYPGTAAAGFQMLSTGLDFDRPTADILNKAFARPVPRLTEGKRLLAAGVRTAIDISDGLLADLGHICRQSRCSARIEIERLPLHPQVLAAFGDLAPWLALSGGEDYELLFTAAPGVIEDLIAGLEGPVAVIGEITAGDTGEVTVLDGRGNPVPVEQGGWEHFGPAEKGG